jgi:uncharacterized SAM-dependent methyltransferase
MRQAVLQDYSEPDVQYKALKDFEDLFLGKRSGHLSEYMYNGDIDYYAALIETDKDYYPVHSEISLIAKHGDEIADIIGEGCNIIEIGPGPEYSLKRKTIPLLSSFKKLTSYSTLDTNLEYATQASNTVGRALKGIRCDAYEGDCTKAIYKHYNGVTCLLFLGITIANFDEPSSVLTVFYKSLHKGDYCIFTVDCNEDLNSIKKAYDNFFGAQLAYNVMNYFKESFMIEDFDPTKFKFSSKWNYIDSAVHNGLIATERQVFNFNNKKTIIDKGQNYHLIKSRKFKKAFVDNMLRRIGFSIINCFTDEMKGISLYLVKK